MPNNPRAVDNLIPAKKGEVRNPKGRGKGVPDSKTRLKRLLEITQDLKNPITGEVEGFSVAEQLDLQQIIKARRGDTKAYNAILDRFEGKPQQTVDQTIKTETTVTHTVPPEMLEGFTAYLQEQTKKY